MEAEDYIKERVDNQISWYDNKSQRAQGLFKALRLIELICAATIPIVAGFDVFGARSALVVSILGGVIVVCAALIGLGNYHENWVEYRTTCESLRHEKYLYSTKTEPYDVPAPFSLLVQRVEGLVSKENTVWSQHIRAQAAHRSGQD